MNRLQHYPIVYEQVVAWGDMDAFGHVNNVQYYRYIESARIAYMQALDVLSSDIYTVVSTNQCQYLAPVFYPDTLKIAAKVVELRNSACRMHYLLWSEQQQQVVAEAEAVVVFVDQAHLKKTSIPDAIRAKIIQLEQQSGSSLV